MSATLLRLVLANLLVVACGSPVVGQQLDQTQLAADVLSPDAETRGRAVARVFTIPVQKRTNVLWSALSAEFKRTVSEHLRKRDAGLPLTEADGEYLGDTLQAVCRSNDPTLIPYFISVIDTGQMAAVALATHGERAAPSVLKIAEADNARELETVAALSILARMLTDSVRAPLSGQSRQRILQVARRRLTFHTEHVGIVLSAIDLAAATGDGSLLADVAKLGADPHDPRLVGFSAPALEAIRTKASEVSRRR